MARLLILLTLPPDVTVQYRARLSKLFPELDIDVVSQREQAEAALAKADILLTFGQMMKNLKLGLEGANNLKWVQALGTGLDGITDQPALRPSVTVTSLHGVHGAPVSEAALAGMLALSRDIPRLRAQPGHADLGPLAGEAVARQDRRHPRHRRDRRGAGAEVQGVRHEGGRHHLREARRRRASTACTAWTSCTTCCRSSITWCC